MLTKNNKLEDIIHTILMGVVIFILASVDAVYGDGKNVTTPSVKKKKSDI